MADFDRSLQLKPGEVPVLISRAHLLFRRGERARAAADLDAADAAASKESDLRLQMAHAYEGADLLDAAIKQFDLWLEFHAVDARYPAALNGRCWVRALQDRHCRLHSRIATRRSEAFRNPTRNLQDIGFAGAGAAAHGNYEKSIADYDASLKINPKNPWGWYGRGIDEMRQHKASEGQADLARAEALWPQVGEEFTRRGITP